MTITFKELYDNFKVPDHQKEGALLEVGRTYESYVALRELLIEALNPTNLRNPRYKLAVGGELPQRTIIDTTRRGLVVCLFRWKD